MKKYVFVFQGVSIAATGVLLGWASYAFALSSGNPVGLLITLISLPMFYFGLAGIRECEFLDDSLVIREPVFREEVRIPYGKIEDVRLMYSKFYRSPPSYYITIVHESGSEKVGFGFSIDEDFLAALEEHIGPERIFRHDDL